MDKLEDEGILVSTKNLIKLITENPDLDIVFNCGEECYNDDFARTVLDCSQVTFGINEFTLYGEELILDRDDLESHLECDADEWLEKYFNSVDNISNEAYDKAFAEEVSKYTFTKCIKILLG